MMKTEITSAEIRAIIRLAHTVEEFDDILKQKIPTNEKKYLRTIRTVFNNYIDFVYQRILYASG
ncbi:hypothetical protein [Eubacterium aggregans]|uniref:hypothetical protein n=1 Tax=Eubacterium aggregans TaxID=81409 RepID=UPI003F3AAAE1